MILLEGYIDRGFEIDDAWHNERDEARTAYEAGLAEHDTVVIAGQRHLVSDMPSGSELDDVDEHHPLPRCGEGDCWHVLNGRLCPPDPWGDQAVQA